MTEIVPNYFGDRRYRVSIRLWREGVLHVADSEDCCPLRGVAAALRQLNRRLNWIRGGTQFDYVKQS